MQIGCDSLLERAVHMTFKVAAIGIVFLIVAVAPSVAYLCRKEWLVAFGRRLAHGAVGAGPFHYRGVAPIRR